ncbi:MAG: DUF5606 domain-containing protein [Rikenellaceae bacterium]
MKLNEILAISGQPGLYRYVAQSARGVIVESLTDGKRSNVAGHAHVSALSEISMFTEGEDIALGEVFKRLLAQSEGKAAINHKESTDKIKAAFEALLPEYDRSRVHVSDMKKCFAWYNALIAAGATEFTMPEDEVAEEAESAE